VANILKAAKKETHSNTADLNSLQVLFGNILY